MASGNVSVGNWDRMENGEECRLPVRKKYYILIEELSPERNRLI